MPPNPRSGGVSIFEIQIRFKLKLSSKKNPGTSRFTTISSPEKVPPIRGLGG